MIRSPHLKIHIEGNKIKVCLPLLHVIDRERNPAAPVQGRRDVYGIQTLWLPHIFHRPEEVSKNLAGQHFFYIHIFNEEFRLVW